MDITNPMCSRKSMFPSINFELNFLPMRTAYGNQTAQQFLHFCLH